ncbi:nucleolar protein 56 [Trichonephila clavata]|uniref:Nucleolar protein 56 n=1 Tax=Trichonephila clavata TaxID=2740835 RepID=A0A8X6GK93_TRICU|nr:nucleolar protein 56 [Trichonephila clavata]
MPPWKVIYPKVDFTLSYYSKACTPVSTYRTLYLEHRELFSDYEPIFTDGSKSESHVGSALVSLSTVITDALPISASIYTAELHALRIAMEHISLSRGKKFIIYTDSLSALQSIVSLHSSSHPILVDITYALANHLKKEDIRFCWIPGHAGITGNELADTAARSATGSSERFPIPHSDLKACLWQKLQSVWQSNWDQQTENKLHSVMPVLAPTGPSSSNCCEQVIWTRLRLGHTRLTHRHLLFGEPPPYCEILIKIVPDNTLYMKCIQVIKNRRNLSEDVEEQLQNLLNDPVKTENVLELARSSMGMDISELDLQNVFIFTDRILGLTKRRKQLVDYLKSKMHHVAPNLAALIGDFVGARLISHSGSLIGLAKHPASTVQILGAEKALFRAIKTRGNTPKYGLLFHSSFIGKAPKNIKGRISRFLANKCSVASRIDCFRDVPTDVFGFKLKSQVEERLHFYETGVLPRRNGEVMDEALVEAEVAEAATLQQMKKEKKKAKKRKLAEAGLESPSGADDSVAASTEGEEGNGNTSILKRKKKKKKHQEEMDVSLNEDIEMEPKKKKRKHSEGNTLNSLENNVQENGDLDLSLKKKKKKKKSSIMNADAEE